uniref:Uncharacterized protein n=1 Tax=Myotis myotis TaxID=51298 RepID=A0A7J7U5K4_MYOMY|nr:hypothetical protein mMyoMyo1_008892 [Myotis myotis]
MERYPRVRVGKKEYLVGVCLWFETSPAVLLPPSPRASSLYLAPLLPRGPLLAINTPTLCTEHAAWFASGALGGRSEPSDDQNSWFPRVRSLLKGRENFCAHGAPPSVPRGAVAPVGYLLPDFIAQQFSTVLVFGVMKISGEPEELLFM